MLTYNCEFGAWNLVLSLMMAVIAYCFVVGNELLLTRTRSSTSRTSSSVAWQHKINILWAILQVKLDPAWGRGTPFRLCSSLVHSLPHLLLFITFPLFLFSFTLIIFFYCPSDPFLPESSHSVSRREVVGGDRTWV